MTAALLTEAPTIPLKSTTRRAVFGHAPEILTDIYKDSVQMAVWQRKTASALIAESQLFTGKGSTSHSTTLSSSKLRNQEKVLPNLAPYRHLGEDIHLLVDMFSCLFGLKAIGLRFTTLSDAMCPKFHVDQVPCRLITTYIGTGTQWLPHDCVDRSKLGAGSHGLSDGESGLYPSTQSIQALSAGDVALLKGDSWEGNEDAGLVHRSPALNPDQTRLLLTLDFVSTAGN
jgi:hypothetical protein